LGFLEKVGSKRTKTKKNNRVLRKKNPAQQTKEKNAKKT